MMGQTESKKVYYSPTQAASIGNENNIEQTENCKGLSCGIWVFVQIFTNSWLCYTEKLNRSDVCTDVLGNITDR